MPFVVASKVTLAVFSSNNSREGNYSTTMPPFHDALETVPATLATVHHYMHRSKLTRPEILATDRTAHRFHESIVNYVVKDCLYIEKRRHH